MSSSSVQSLVTHHCRSRGQKAMFLHYPDNWMSLCPSIQPSLMTSACGWLPALPSSGRYHFCGSSAFCRQCVYGKEWNASRAWGGGVPRELNLSLPAGLLTLPHQLPTGQARAREKLRSCETWSLFALDIEMPRHCTVGNRDHSPDLCRSRGQEGE